MDTIITSSDDKFLIIKAMGHRAVVNHPRKEEGVVGGGGMGTDAQFCGQHILFLSIIVELIVIVVIVNFMFL